VRPAALQKNGIQPVPAIDGDDLEGGWGAVPVAGEIEVRDPPGRLLRYIIADPDGGELLVQAQGLGHPDVRANSWLSGEAPMWK